MKNKIIISIFLGIITIVGTLFIKLNKQKDINKIEPISAEKDIIENNEFIDDNGIFSDYYTLAKNKLKTMTLDEKINQLFLVRYPDDEEAQNIQKTYQFAGFIFFEKDFEDKTKEEVNEMIKKVQEVSKIPILTGVDEEGGEVVRISSNEKLVTERFKSPSDLYKLGGLELIRQDTIDKSNILSKLGINLNLAPVVDVATNKRAYMYERTLKQDTKITSDYAKEVIEASKKTDVSYVLKHFPGYGNNKDSHGTNVIDNRSYESIIENDIPPFEEGIKSGAEAVLISHNFITNIDQYNPASLSKTIHDFLRKELNFTGIIMTDDLEMLAIDDKEEATIKAIEAGNDLIIITDYQTSTTAVKKAINENRITEKDIENIIIRTLAWKYYKGIIYDNQK